MTNSVINKEFLDSLNIPPDKDFVVYDVARRKIYFFTHDRDDYRLKMLRGKRRLPIRVKASDILIRINYNGVIERNPVKMEEFIVEEA